MSLLTLYFTYRLTSSMFGPLAGGLSSLLLLGTPVFAIGMVAATPDAPLSALWTLFTWQLHRALTDDRPGAWPRLGRPLLLGAVLGLAFLAKYTGACLVITAAMMVAGKEGRVWLRRPGFWLGAAVALALASPVFVWNASHGWAGVLHRLVWTQEGAGFGLGNAGALIGGQLLYVGPLMLPLLGWAVAHAFRRQRTRSEHRLLLASSLPAIALTYLLTLWSDVAEPHWPAVAYLPLFAGAAGMATQVGGAARRLARFACGAGIGAFALAHVVVLTPLLPSMPGSAGYRPEHDLANELRGWPEVGAAIRALEPGDRPVVAAFYTQCAQLAFELSRPGDPPVRCASPEVDDFDLWYGPFRLPPAGALFVTDNRFEHDPLALVEGAEERGAPTTIEIRRGDRWVRRFRIHELVRAGGQGAPVQGKR
jgi:4-amino-4-deoxy-L-arabinose transferase-like glycosyltransferase